METQSQNPVEINIFEEADNNRERQLKTVIKNARASLYIISAFYFIVSMFTYYSNTKSELAYHESLTGLVIAILFAGLGFLSNRQPFTSLLSGLILYVLLIGSLAIHDPSILLRGFIFKFFIVGWLIRGIISARKLKKSSSIQQNQ